MGAGFRYQRRWTAVFAGLCVICAGVATSACSTAPANSSAGPTAADLPGSDVIGLDDKQHEVVEASVKQMLGERKATDFVGVAARRQGGSDGLHVCGYVKANGVAGRTRFYVELRDENGKPIAHRGQVALDDAKRAKVRFVCRHHEVG